MLFQSGRDCHTPWDRQDQLASQEAGSLEWAAHGPTVLRHVPTLPTVSQRCLLPRQSSRSSSRACPAPHAAQRAVGLQASLPCARWEEGGRSRRQGTCLPSLSLLRHRLRNPSPGCLPTPHQPEWVLCPPTPTCLQEHLGSTGGGMDTGDGHREEGRRADNQSAPPPSR